MKKLKLLWRICRTTDADKIVLGFVAFVLFSAFIFTLVEPGIGGYGDGIWYAFAVFTTIGFGDMVAVTLIGRISTIMLGLYGILVIALIPGIIVNYYIEMSKIKARSSVATCLDQMERLPELSREDLEKISEAVHRKRYKL